MQGLLILECAGGGEIILDATGGGNWYRATLPTRDKDIVVDKVHFEVVLGGSPVTILKTLEHPATFVAQETGTWSVMNVSGKWRLEYVTDSLYGRPARHSNVYQWDIDSEDVNQAM